MVTRNPQDDYLKTALRLPRDLHAEISAEADRSRRSLNSEIVRRLQLSLVADRLEVDDDPPQTELDLLTKKVARLESLIEQMLQKMESPKGAKRLTRTKPPTTER